MQSKSNSSHGPGYLNNVQLVEIKDLHRYCIALDVSYHLSDVSYQMHHIHHLGGGWPELP